MFKMKHAAIYTYKFIVNTWGIQKESAAFQHANDNDNNINDKNNNNKMKNLLRWI